VRLLTAFRLRRFLTETERGQIAAGLDEASRHTRARIGLTIDERKTRDPQVRARVLFQEWRLPENERPTAILIYVSAPSQSFAVIGGDEIQRLAPQTFWESLDRDLHHHFQEGRYCDGIFKAIAQVALQLQHHFPCEPEGGEEDSREGNEPAEARGEEPLDRIGCEG
jgi:uncharacterized membrane protein